MVDILLALILWACVGLISISILATAGDACVTEIGFIDTKESPLFWMPVFALYAPLLLWLLPELIKDTKRLRAVDILIDLDAYDPIPNTTEAGQ